MIDKDFKQFYEGNWEPDMNEPIKRLEEYLGDGVYAIQADHGFWLRTGDHHVSLSHDNIWIEPEVFDALIRFALKIGYAIKTT